MASTLFQDSADSQSLSGENGKDVQIKMSDYIYAGGGWGCDVSDVRIAGCVDKIPPGYRIYGNTVK